MLANRKFINKIKNEYSDAGQSDVLSIDRSDLPSAPPPGRPSTYRSITVDGQEIEFTQGFTDLHTRVYEEVLAGRGFGIDDASPSVDLVYRIRNTPLSPKDDTMHPFLAGR